MNIEEIKKLAKEYAEKELEGFQGLLKDIPFNRESYIHDFFNSNSNFFNWLLNKYCIVSKSKIIKKYNELKELSKTQTSHEINVFIDGRINLLEDLFGGEIFKN